MTVQLDRMRSLVSVIGAAEDQLAVARWTLRETAVALLRCGDATLAEITRASGMERGELLDLLDMIPPSRQAAGSRGAISPPQEPTADGSDAVVRHLFRMFIPRLRRLEG
jgi:hypothetical protein